MRLRLFFAMVAFLISLPAVAEVKLREEVPFRIDSGLTKAEYFIATRKYAESIGESLAVIKRHGPQADAYTYLGIAYMRLGDEKKARENLGRAVALTPTHLGAHAYLTLMYLDKNNMPKALEQMQVLRAVCGASGCEELLMVESAINAARKGTLPSQATGASAKPAAVRGETPRSAD